MPRKYNNDEFFELVLGVVFGIMAIVLLWIVIQDFDFSSLLESSDGNPSSRLRGIPTIFMIVLGMVGLYYSIKKILKANKKKNDT